MPAVLSPRLTMQDASFLYTETPTGPMHAASIGIFEGVIPFDEFLAFNEARIHLVPRYRQRLTFVPFNVGHPTWQDDPAFDISNHIQHAVLPPDSTLETGIQKALELAEPRMDRTRPMWKSVLIEGVPGKTLVSTMVHHCMIDGASGIELSTVMMDFDPEAPAPPPSDEPWAPAPLLDDQSMLAAAARELAIDQFAQLSDAASLMLDPARGFRQQLQLSRAASAMMGTFDRPVLMAPWNRGAVGRKRTLAFRKYPFAMIRALRTAHGGTVNDIALTVISEAAARYLREHGYEAPGRYFRIMCPVNVRREGASGELGNRVSSMMPTLPAWPMDVRERHKFVVTEMSQRKAANEAQSIELLMEQAAGVPPSAMAVAAFQSSVPDPGAGWDPLPSPPLFLLPPLPSGFNFTVTNVPGVQVPQYTAGRRLVDTVGTIMLGGNLGYGVVVTTYNQNLFFNLTAEPSLMPDVERMAELVDAVVTELVGTAK